MDSTGDGGGLHVAVVGPSAVTSSDIALSNVTTSGNIAKGMCCCMFFLACQTIMLQPVGMVTGCCLRPEACRYK